MASQSIVDFIKDGLSSTYPGGYVRSPVSGAGSASSALVNPSPRPAASPSIEIAYITYAAKIIAALDGSTGLTARQVFDAIGGENFAAFQSAVAEMVSRGVLHVVGRDPKYGDDIYSLAAPSGA